MKAYGLVRLGKAPEMRFTPAGDPVLNISGAYSYGKKGADGNRQTQWIECSYFGKRAESVAPYLDKGQLIMISASDVHIETWEKKDGTPGVTLRARLDDLQFTGKQEKELGARNNERHESHAADKSTDDIGAMDDDIHF